MELTPALGRQAGISLREVGGLELATLADARAFLDAGLNAGVLVLGIEGFYFDSGRVRPDMGAIGDFSQVPKSEESVCEADPSSTPWASRRCCSIRASEAVSA